MLALGSFCLQWHLKVSRDSRRQTGAASVSSSVKVLGSLEGPEGVCVEGCFLDRGILFFEHIVSLCLLLGESSSLISRVITESCLLICCFVEFVCLVGN